MTQNEEPKYRSSFKKVNGHYGDEDRPYLTKSEAIKSMEEFMRYLAGIPPVLESKWHIYLIDNEWHTIADSVKDEFGKGEHIQEFNVSDYANKTK